MDKFIQAERGHIYNWRNPNKTDEWNEHFCVVVSSNRRSRDNIVSILFLSTWRGFIGDDVVPIEFGNVKWCVRTDLVTYTPRSYLLEDMGEVSEDAMTKIDMGMLKALGLDSPNWEKMYNNLLDTVIARSNQ